MDPVAEIVNSLVRAVQAIILYIPNVIGALIVLFIGYYIGDIAGKAVNKIVNEIVEKPLEKTEFGKSVKDLGLDLSDLLGGLTKAFVIAISIVAAVDILNIGGSTGALIYSVALYLPKLIGGIAVLTLGLILSLGLARYVGKFLEASISGRYKDISKMVESLIMLGLVAVVLTIALQLLELQGSLVYPLILGVLIIAGGIIIADISVRLIVEAYPEFHSLAPITQFLMILVFTVIGIGGIFAQFATTTRIIETLSWGLAIAFALILLPVVVYLTKEMLILAKERPASRVEAPIKGGEESAEEASGREEESQEPGETGTSGGEGEAGAQDSGEEEISGE